jgi:transposase
VAIATQERHAGVNYIDETPWVRARRLQWLWVRVSDLAALSMLYPHRSIEAFAALIDDGAELLGSEGYGVYEHWVHTRQTCLVYLIRSARG